MLRPSVHAFAAPTALGHFFVQPKAAACVIDIHPRNPAETRIGLRRDCIRQMAGALWPSGPVARKGKSP
ncbi:hypothetical protein MPLA_150013 [Mesorhizobium sp. ORS 3359]|nr:hypothetical protein MPLA_150013 [Mesorhizobium sp. ORS 3359]